MVKPVPKSAILIASLKTNSGKMLITENTTTVYAAYWVSSSNSSSSSLRCWSSGLQPHIDCLRSQRAYLALAQALQDVDHQDRRHLDRLRRQHLRLRLHRPPLPTGSMQGGQVDNSNELHKKKPTKSHLSEMKHLFKNNGRGWVFCLKFAVLALQRRKVARRLENLGKFSSLLMLKDVYEGSPSKTTDPIFQSRQIRGIPDICHFFTQAKFLENKMYTEKRQFFALNL